MERVVRDWKTLTLEDGAPMCCTTQTNDGVKTEIVCDRVDRTDDGSIMLSLKGKVLRILPAEMPLTFSAVPHETPGGG